VQTWSRLVLFVTPYWRRLLLSLVFGGLSALMWSTELALTYPLTIMFGEHHTVPNYVRHQIEHSSKLVADLKSELDETELERKELDRKERERALLPDVQTPARSKLRLKMLNEERRLQQRLDIESRRVWLMSWVETRVLPKLPQDPFHLFAVLSGLVLAVTLLKGGCSFIQDSIAGGVAELVTIDLRQALFRRTLQLDPQTIALGGTQKLMNDFTYTLQQLARCLGDLGGRVVREPLKAATCIAGMLYLNWQLTCLLIAFVPLAGWMFHLFGQRLKRATRRVLDSVGQIYKTLEETLVNVKVVIAFDTAGQHRRQFHRRNRENYSQSMRMVRINALSAAAVELLVVFAVLVVLLPAAYLVLRNVTSIGGIKLATVPPTFPELAMFYALLAGVIDPLRKFSKFYNTIRQAGVLAGQFFRQLDRESLVPISTSPQWLPRLAEGLEFRDVHFTYARAADDDSPERGPVLNGLDLRIEYGEVVAIVGPNGSGKSTLAGLLPRFFDPDHGSVLFDGLDLRHVRLRELRDQLAIVPQDTLLFDDTIAANIRYGRPDATDEKLCEAARRAHVLDFTEGLPQGLDTPVGEGGRQLSGGQRQRVALARAMLRDPRVLLLDEPTSAIDAESELLIHRALKDFVRGRTTLIITHTLSPALLEYVSRIVVLDRGRAIATGSHSDLQAACPIYRQLFEGPLSAAA
jgi:ATP-binding cassette, subfamily B, bacterial MsbA